MKSIQHGLATGQKGVSCQSSVTINDNSAKQNNKPALFMRWILVLLMFVTVGANAQITVTNPGNTTPAMAGTYTSLTNALVDVNNRTAISGPVTITLSAPQTAPAGGYVLNNVAITGGSTTNRFIFDGGANTVTAPTPQTSGNLNDAIFKIIGADFITIQNFVMNENAANTTTTTASNNMTEFGVALFYASLTNGAQNNIIQNNTITLNRTYLNTFGIYSNTRHSSTSISTSAEVTAASGSNSNNKVYGNIISNVNYGIVFIGAGTTIAAIDNGNDIGGTSALTGNTITNWGGGAAASSYVSLTGSNYCIFNNQQINDNVSFNTITSASLTNAVTTGGILKNYSAASPTSGTITTTMNNNTVQITNNPTGAAISIIGINNQGLTPLLSTATMSMNNNTVQNCVLGGSTATTAGITAITNLSLPGTMNMNGNSVINNAITATTATSGTLAGITNSGAAGTVNINSNIIRSFASTATSGQIQGIVNTGAVVTALNITTNQLGNATSGFFSTSTATSGTLFGVSTSSSASTCAVSITGNDIRGITYNTAASAANTYFVNSATSFATFALNNNTFTNLTINSTGSVTFLGHSGTFLAASVSNINGNSIVTAYNKTGAGGTIIIRTSASSTPAGAVVNFQNNIFSNMTFTGAITFTGYFDNDGGAPTKSITGNTFNNNNYGTGVVTQILAAAFNGNNTTISNNTITNQTTSSNSITCINLGGSGTSTSETCANNTISNITSTGTGGSVVGITCASVGTATNINNNSISTLASTGASVVTALAVTGGGTTTNVFKNTICDISGSSISSTVNGILVSGGTTINLSNNRIGDLRTTTASGTNPLIGINITGGTTINAYYNTVSLNATSSGATFGSSAISTSTTPTLTLNNNIFSNTSTANGGVITAAYRRSSTTLTTYGATSNRNDFIAPIIFADGTNAFATFSNYQTFLLPGTRDANSISVVPPFLSTACGNANFLKINTATATQIESGGANIAGITDDFENDTRQGNGGYSGTGTGPDIGADEFNGTPAAVCAGTPTSATINGANSVCTGTGTTLSLSTVYTDLGIVYQWKFSTTPGGPYTNLGTAATQATGNLTVTTYYVADITCTNSSLTFTTAEKTVTINALPTVGVSPSSASFCTPGGSAVTLTASGASTYTWLPTSGLTPTTGAVVAASPSTTTTYTVSGTDGNGCVNTATSTITVSASPINVVATATPSNICSGSTATLNGSAVVPFTANQYSFAASTGSLDPMTGATTVIASNTTSGGTGDDTPSGVLSLGFTFYFEGVAYTQYSISPDGWIKFGSGAATADFSNGVANSTNLPKIFPIWDDLSTGSNGNAKVLITGSAPTRIFKVQWLFTNPRALTGSANATVQAWLYEGTNVIEYRYGTAGTSSSASAGLTGLVSTNFQSITYSSNTSSNATANNTLTTAPAVGTMYTFTPPSALTYAWAPSGLVVSPNAQSTATTALTSTTTYTLTVSNGGCSSTATTTVTVSPLTAGSITLTGSQCANTNFTATANTTGGSPVYNYAWSDGVGGVYPNAATVTVNKPAGSYTLSVIVTDGCGGIVSMFLPVTVNALPTVTITPTPGTARICGTGSVSMTASGASAYVWTPTTFLTPSNGLSATEVSAATTTTAYTVTGTDGNGCVGTATQTVTVGPAVSVTPTATPSTICSGQTSALNAGASTTPALNYSVAGISPSAETPSGSFTNLILAGVYTPAAQGTATTPQDDGYFDGIALPFTFNFYGVNYTSIRISTNGNVQFGTVSGTGGNPGAASWTPQTIPTAGGFLDNFIAGPWMDQDMRTATGGTLRYYVNGSSPNQKFVISYEAAKVFSSSDANTSQIILNENGTIDVLLLGGGLIATTTKAIGIENATGTLGVTPAGRNAGAWTTLADEAWRFTPAILNYAWTPATGLTPSATVANPTTPALTSTTTYSVTATEAVSGCSVFGTVTVTIGTANITATAGTGGSISPNGLTTINCGLNQTYTISPDACHTIADVVVDGVSQGATGSYTFTAVTAGAHTIAATFNLITYTITATSGANGTVTPAGASTVNCGANATYTITPAACYAIADVLVDGVSVGAVGTYTFTNVTANHTISATFVLTTYTITATSGANGTVTPAGASTVNCGANATYTITPAACYSIADVLVDGVSVGAVGTFTFTNVTANHTISATFSLNTYTITATSGANGTVTPAGASTVNCGDNATYTITPAACYAIADVLVDGLSVGAVGTFTFTNVTANHTISATFVLTTYTITATSGANGTVTPAGASTVNCGDNATYTITPAACYAIADVLVDGVSVGAVGTYTFTNVTANHTISATFVQTTYTITATSGANGTVTPAGASTVNCGDNATYTITPAACYAIADVLVDGVSVGAVGTYTFTNVTANHTISVTFSLTTYTIAASSGANGSVTPAGTSTVNCGDNATYTITPAACYAIADVLVDGVSVGAVGTYTFTNVTANHTISATFSLTTYTIAASSGANGSVTPAGTSTVNCGDNATYTITPAACYAIADVLVDGVSVGAVGTYTFTNVTANHTISATFSLTTYTIAASSGANGSVTPAGTSTVNCGDNATYTITPAACYAIADVLVDGVSVGAVGTYTFTNVTANHTISATFSLTTYTIAASSGANGSITPAGTSTVNCGDNATYTITPAACYAIADVLVDGVSVGAVGTYTFTNVTANHTISATFSLTTYTIAASSGANGSVTPAGTSTVNCGDNATNTITPAACYAIADVLVDGVSVGAVGTYTFTNVTANHTISATFSLTTYTIAASSGANGSVTPAGTSTVNCGANATYTITPAACYAIADVLVDGVSVGAVGTYTFTNVTANHTISATFSLTTYTIAASSGANGSVTPAGTSTVNCGDNATYTITPAACYAIADVLVDGVSVGAVGTYTFTNVTANHTISATFSLTTYTIAASSGANGSVTPAGTSTVNCGDNATYTITPAACYAIADVLVDGVSVGAVGTYTFTNVTANHTISATFSLTTYTIAASSGANGSVTPAGTSTVNCGDNATYTITPAACYAIADVLVDGVSVGAVGTYTFTNVTANHTISATFVQITYTITATSGANGTVTPAGASTVNCGANATYTITPAACYAIADVLVDGVSVGAVGTFTFTNVTANHTISATFVLTTYTITATSGANGTVTPAGASTVNCGANATYTITPAACYAIADVLVDGVSVGAAGTFTFTNVTANHTISATFVLTTYTITATSGANGTVTPAGASTVNCGANATYTITPAACYAIADVLVDGVSVGAVGTFTFTNVTANHTISATFVLTTYTITATSGANGTVTPAGASTVNCGSNATYTITPNACYSIANVIVDGVSVGAVGTYTFTNVTANHTISATFTLNTYTITVTAGANGSITPGTGSVNCGANATYTITPNGGYAVQNVIVDGVSQGAVGTYTFTNVTANHTISATFVAVGGGFTITSSAGANGTIAPNGVTNVPSGGNQSYTMTPAACYHVNDVLVDGVSVGAVTTYTFTNVTANHTISATFAINAALLPPVVTGPVNVCPYLGTGTQVTYTFNSAGATGYSFIIPSTNVTLVSSTSNSITLTFTTAFKNNGNKQIRVTALSPCGNSTQTIYVLVAQAPGTPQPITGPTSVCPVIGTAGTLTYTIPSVVGATSYIWTAQLGTTTITHPNGPGPNDTTVNVSFTNGFTSSNLTVAAANDSCGASNVRSLPLTKANPSQPGLIAGSTNACPYMAPGGIPATYSVAAVLGQTYNWTVPAGAIGLTGQGTNAISFTYPASFVNGTISVTATNGCGTSAARTLSINKLLPATPGVIDVIQTQPCPNRIYTYTISATPASSTSVQWTVPVGATLVSGQGTNSITVSYPGTSFNSNVTAQSFNNCGSSTIRSTPVHLPTCVGEKQSNTFTKGGTTTAPAAETMKVNVYPNPTVSDFKLQVVTAGKQTINVRVVDAQGRSIKTFEVMPYQTINVGSDLKAGAYIMEVRQGNEVKVTKLLKF